MVYGGRICPRILVPRVSRMRLATRVKSRGGHKRICRPKMTIMAKKIRYEDGSSAPFQEKQFAETLNMTGMPADLASRVAGKATQWLKEQPGGLIPTATFRAKQIELVRDSIATVGQSPRRVSNARFFANEILSDLTESRKRSVMPSPNRRTLFLDRAKPATEPIQTIRTIPYLGNGLRVATTRTDQTGNIRVRVKKKRSRSIVRRRTQATYWKSGIEAENQFWRVESQLSGHTTAAIFTTATSRA